MEWVRLVEVVGALGITGFSTVLWFLFLSVRKDARDALDKLADYKLHVAETYVTHDGLTKVVSNLNQTIERLIVAVQQNSQETRDGFSELHRRIDGKADK